MLRPPRVGSGFSFLVSPCFGTFSHAKDNMGEKRRESRRRLCTSLRKPAVWLFYFLDFFFLFYCCDFWFVFSTIKNYIEFYLNFAHVYAQVGAAKVPIAPPSPVFSRDGAHVCVYESSKPKPVPHFTILLASDKSVPLKECILSSSTSITRQGFSH